MRKWGKMHRKVCAVLLSAMLLLSICAGCAAKPGAGDGTQQEQTQTVTQNEKKDKPADKAADKNAADKDADKEGKSDKKDDSRATQEVKTEEKKEEAREKAAEDLAAEQKAKEDAVKKKAAEEAEKKKTAEENEKKNAEAEAKAKVEAEQEKQQGSTSSSGSGSSANTTSTGSTCTISISCSTILNNMDKCAENKKAIVPADGVILAAATVSFSNGETVFDVLQRVCREHGISLEYSTGGSYIKGIACLYEFDVGSGSGWMYTVNGAFAGMGCSQYTLKDGDSICWSYTCDLGADVGGGYAVG